MASTKFIVVLAIIAIVSPSIVVATDYMVGDESGWTSKFDYQGWAKNKMFYVGDRLVFKYTVPNHNVYIVNATGFQDCIVPPVTEALTTGHDIITLATPGKKWYICGKPNHCANLGMKLAITVWEGTPAPAPNLAPATLTSWLQVLGAGFVIAVTMVDCRGIVGV